jgi:hypothetical protein
MNVDVKHTLKSQFCMNKSMRDLRANEFFLWEILDCKTEMCAFIKVNAIAGLK